MEYLLQHLLINSAARYPQKEAVRMNGAGLTYSQLDKLSNQVARVLRENGVKRGDRVGIYVHKSFASIISIYGILKAGGVYVPLDPNAPAKRLAYITRDCGVKVLLTSPAKMKVVPEFFQEGTPLEAVVLMEQHDDETPALPGAVRLVTWHEVRSRAEDAVQPVPTIETDLAYILYTSGSTGMPKGVMIAHRTIFTFINWCRDTFHITSEDRITSHAPLHFDLSTFDIYVTTQAGATIILVAENLSTLPVQLVSLLQNERVTVTYLVPSILSYMVN
jgi:non-ribosomal peptide synthetase component F